MNAAWTEKLPGQKMAAHANRTTQLFQLLFSCCRRRYRAFSVGETRVVQMGLDLSSASTALNGIRTNGQPNPSGYESDYFDARSEVSDWGDCVGECELTRTGNASLLDHCSNPGGTAREAEPCAAENLLAQLRLIECRCRGTAAAGGRDDQLYFQEEAEAESSVECILREENSQFWVCRTDGCPVVTACAHFRLAAVAMDDAVEAIRIPKERLKWDGQNLKELEILGEGDLEDPLEGQVVRCVVTAPRPLKDREMLQKRWQLPLPGGGQAFVLRSFEDPALVPDRPQLYVRAFTHLSGYLLRPLDGDKGVELTMISRCDIGGIVPAWVQNLVRRLAKREVIKFAKMLHAHCDRLAAARAESKAKAAKAQQLREVARLRPLSTESNG